MSCRCRWASEYLDSTRVSSKKDLGGSALLDLGIYNLQFAQYIFKDEPVRVTARGELNSDGVDSDETIILEYEGGRRAVLNIHSKLRLKNDATVSGTKGQISVSKILLSPNPANECIQDNLYFGCIHLLGNKYSLNFDSFSIPRLSCFIIIPT